MKPPGDDTIVAIATPVGEGALSIIRISGPEALGVGDRLFRGKTRIIDAAGHTVHLGRVVDVGGRILDETLATVFRAPRSYTGEDAVEFSCHGGLLVTRSVLEAALGAGARQAEPGEFTRRAFLNGRLDLAQAEAVADLISASSSRAQALSLEQLRGRVGERVRSVRTTMVDLCALLEIDLDFTEEGIELITQHEIGRRIVDADHLLEAMLSSFELGRMYREGVSVVLTGKPNVGKSSLFNALLKEDRAIVTAVPGTTRDPLEENITLSGMLFKLTDTAGLREAVDLPEVEGVNRTRAKARDADVIVIVVDATETRDRLTACSALDPPQQHQRVLVAFNKSDLLRDALPAPEEFKLVESPGAQVYVSARTGEGLSILRDTIVSLALRDRAPGEDGLYVANRRHIDALQRARACLGQAGKSLSAGRSNEFIAFDVREAIDCLAEITGEVTREDVLNSVFSRFCVGK